MPAAHALGGDGVAVVTGANRGIGLGLATALKARGMRVVAVCRRSSEELDALGVTVIDGGRRPAPSAAARHGSTPWSSTPGTQGCPPARRPAGIDVSDDGCVDVLRARLGDTPVQLLISNAAILGADTLEGLDFDLCRREVRRPPARAVGGGGAERTRVQPASHPARLPLPRCSTRSMRWARCVWSRRACRTCAPAPRSPLRPRR